MLTGHKDSVELQHSTPKDSRQPSPESETRPQVCVCVCVFTDDTVANAGSLYSPVQNF